MARNNFRVELGLEIVDENGQDGSYIIRGAGAPAGTSGATDDAPIGSLYLRTDGEGELYHKITSTSAAVDWEPFADSSVYTALGIAFDDEDFGTYTGGILTDSTDAKTNIQELSDAIEALAAPVTGTVAVVAATPTVINSCLVDSCCASEWEICVYETATESNKEYFKIGALHDGETAADATSTDSTVFSKMKVANIAGLDVDITLSGTGAAQAMELTMSATAAITVKFRRSDVPF